LKAWILDTGPLVAYIDASEKQHARVAALLDAFTGQLLTTTAVITEAMHLLATDRGGPALLAELVAQSGMQIFDFTEAAALSEAARRHGRLASRPPPERRRIQQLHFSATQTDDVLNGTVPIHHQPRTL
jgi:predicted nucleic acid-binding protein